VVRVGDVLVAETTAAVRVLETASPPTVYLPPGDVRTERLAPGAGGSHCEWKGAARYWDVVLPDRRIVGAGWSYDAPFEEFASLAGYLSFYPALVECFVDDVRVQPQPGGFYGGWVTPEIVGPFKGEPGTSGW
jgi:uncharacterized protein (DUF427 family)